jgi:hypothetical protein
MFGMLLCATTDGYPCVQYIFCYYRSSLVQCKPIILVSEIYFYHHSQVLETTSCRNVGKGCVHKTQSGRTLPRTLHKR